MPVTIGTTTNANSSGKMPQKKTYRIGDYFFCFYTDGTNLGYRTSQDGLTWSDFTAIRACTNGYYVDVQYFPDYSTTYIYYVYGVDANNYPLIFRRGAVSGNSITWENEVTIANASLILHYAFPTIAVATTGKLYVVCCRGTSTNHRLVLFSNPNNDGSGTWSLDSTFSSTVNGDPGTHTHGRVEGLTATKVEAVWQTDTAGSQLFRRRFDGSSWLAEEYVTHSQSIWRFYGVARNGDDLGVVYCLADLLPYFRLLSWSAFGDLEQISDTLTPDSVTISVNTSNGRYYAFWRERNASSNNTIYYSERQAVWGATQTLVNGERYVKDPTINPTPSVTNNKVGLQWAANELSPYNQRFHVLDLSPAPPPSHILAPRFHKQHTTTIFMSGWVKQA